MQEDILEAIADFDGVHVYELASAGDRSPSKADIAFIIDLLVHEEASRTAASWILKAWLEHGATLSEAQASRTVEVLVAHDGWEAQLHILQSLPYMRLTKDHAQALLPYVARAVSDDTKLIRAWSIYACALIAPQLPSEVASLHEYAAQGLKDEAGSVRSRAKKALDLFDDLL